MSLWRLHPFSLSHALCDTSPAPCLVGQEGDGWPGRELGWAVRGGCSLRDSRFAWLPPGPVHYRLSNALRESFCLLFAPIPCTHPNPTTRQAQLGGSTSKDVPSWRFAGQRQQCRLAK